MRLGRGATGFRGRGDEPLPDTDLALFRRACWEGARHIRGRVEELARARAATFHSVTVSGRDQVYVVVCHAHLPVIAFADVPPVPGVPLSGFVRPPSWADAFGAVGFRCLSVEELSTPMADANLTRLAEAELAQIRYWRPGVVSDLLFNWWD